jgi:predicted phosphate transport protein (TIGR00153 family)
MNFGLNVNRLFGRTSALEAQIDEFLDKITECGLVFHKALQMYMERGYFDEFEAFLAQGSALESRGDNLRRSIETDLYAQTLIPDLRGDVLKLLEDLDYLMNIYEANLYRFSIQRPDIPQEYRRDFLEIADTAIKCVESVVLAARSFFRDIQAVRDHNSKVMFYEKQADQISTRMQRAIFGSKLPLDQKMHLRYFVERIDELANEAEDIADSLAIFAIKRQF